MADDDKNKLSFLLDLDIKDFTESGLKAQGIISKIGSSENLVGLLEGLTSVGIALGVVGVAAFAFKKALDLTLEGEEIERVNKQFELLADNAGISAKALEEGLTKAAKGLVDTDDLIKIANSSIVKMGQSAEKLPEILDIARKSVQVYGGDAKSNFEAITEAISNGNTKALKHYGIIVDSAKAEREFAAANNTTVAALSEVGKRQAILNAALAEGNKAFKDVGENSESATTTMKTLGVTFGQIGQVITIAIEKSIGPAIRFLLKGTQSVASKFKDLLQSMVGGNEASAEKMIATNKKVTQASIIDMEKQKQLRLAFEKQLEKIDNDFFKLQQGNIKSIAQIDNLVKQQTLQSAKAHALALKTINSNTALDSKQKIQLVAAETRRYNEQTQIDEQNLSNVRATMLNNYVKNSTDAFDGIARSFAANTQKMKAQQADMGARGAEIWNSLSSNATAAFGNMGKEIAEGKNIASATADAMKGFFLGMLGDRAMAEGSLLLLSSIWPPNPLGIAAGTGLIALGGALKSLAGPSSSGSKAPSSPSVSAVASGSAPRLEDTSSQASTIQQDQNQVMQQQQKPQRTVQVNIAGNYLETDQTRRMLMDLMRQESDATGFAYNQIGAGV